jgi:hypothetical protein
VGLGRRPLRLRRQRVDLDGALGFGAIANEGRLGWQRMSGYNKRSRIEAAIGRYKQVIGDGLRFRNDDRRATEVTVAVYVMNRMLELGRPLSIRIA